MRAEQALQMPGLDARAARREADRYLVTVVRDYQRIFREEASTAGLPEICARLTKLEHWSGITVGAMPRAALGKKKKKEGRGQ